MILCCGEALIDMLPRTSGEGEACFAPHAGGAVFNTAIALGRLGVPTGFFSGISTDQFGTVLAETLAASKVDTSFAIRNGRPTTLAFVHLKGGHATYDFYDENTAGRMLTEIDLPTLTDSVEALYFGSISLVNDPAASAYEALCTREAASRVIMYDPNIRPGFVTDVEGFKARVRRMMALADIVKLSDEDLHWIEGDRPTEALAAELLGRGPKIVVITAGGTGATAYTTREELFVPARKVTVADTVGAGDTFNAAILASLHRQGKLRKPAVAAADASVLEQMLTLGVKASAVTVSRAGANPPWARELD